MKNHNYLNQLTETRGIEYLDPFLVKGSLTAMPCMPRLTDKVELKPNVNEAEVDAFINYIDSISDWINILIRHVERKLRRYVAIYFSKYRGDKWLNNPKFFMREKKSYYDCIIRILDRLRRHDNIEGLCSKDVLRQVYFPELSIIYLRFGNRLAKKEVAEHFGILDRRIGDGEFSTLDTFCEGIKVLSNYVRNQEAHVNASFRIIESMTLCLDATSMMYPWISSQCNLGKFYGRTSFLVYITTNFPEYNCQLARKEIKRLMSLLPTRVVNYLGIPSNWQNEPMWSRI
jgi:hypothetical protein